VGGQVRVRVQDDGPRAVRVSVQDDGPGIEPEALPHVFERRWSRGQGAGSGGSTFPPMAAGVGRGRSGW